MVDQEISEVALLFLTDRGLERYWLLRNAHHFADLRYRQLQFLGQLFAGGLAAGLLHQPSRGPDQLIDGLDHVDRDTDRASLIGDGACNRLSHPPCGVRGELVPTAILEL